MASYHDFAEKFESGMKIMEIVNEGAISRTLLQTSTL